MIRAALHRRLRLSILRESISGDDGPKLRIAMTLADDSQDVRWRNRT